MRLLILSGYTLMR